MRSLIQLTESIIDITSTLTPLSPSSNPTIQILSSTVNPDTNTLYLACSISSSEDPSFTALHLLKSSTNPSSSKPSLSHLIELPPVMDLAPPLEEAIKERGIQLKSLVGVQYLPDSGAVCVAYAHGDLVVVPVGEGANAGSNGENIVGTVDPGLLAMEWSPERELVVLITGENNVLVMTKDFDTIAEVPAITEEFGEGQFVNVGWGKKETQFHGSLGKQAAQAKPVEVVASISPDDDRLPRISWRGDGNYFVCSLIDPRNERRTIRVYNREGVLQSTSEAVPFLEHTLSWRPSGNLIASTQRLSHRHDVVFFERNGLRHGEFQLREPESTHVIAVLWNQDSTILAIHLSRLDRSSNKRIGIVQLWTMGNYHWYLKQEILPFAGDSITHVAWDPESFNRLYVVSQNGILRTLEYTTEVQNSSSRSPSNPASVAVIDGTEVLLTPYRDSNVPPPMSTTKLGPLPNPVAGVCFGVGSEGDDVAVLLGDGRLGVFQSSGRGWEAPKLVGWVRHFQPVGVSYRQLAWAKDGTLFMLTSSVDPAAVDVITYLQLERSEVTATDVNQAIGVLETGTIRIPGGESGLLKIHACLETGSVIVETVKGVVCKVVRDGSAFYTEIVATLPTPCYWIASIEVGLSDIKRTAIVGLSDRNVLYVNNKTIATDVTSFFVHDEYLIITTLTHTARFIPIRVENEEDIALPAPSSAISHDETIRRVERGSRIVVAVPNDTKLVLQMPRGNLESIFPRALVLSIVRSSLDKLDFLNAFKLCRKHRVDMNLLIDHAPAVFMENVGKFVRDIDDPDFLNLFVSSVSDTDVTVTMFPSATYKNRMPYFQSTPGDKTNRVCDAVREALGDLDTVKYISTVLTAYARKSPPDMESAMREVKGMR
ncbi:hypothetical protein HDU76_012780, partial [Blyttiomyces sp. JEL0837]